jgi:hypothetical protein
VAPLTRAQKRTHSQIGAHLMHALNDVQKTSAPGRRAAEERYLRQVREAAAAKGETITDQEAQRRAEHLKRAFMAQIAAKSAAARRSRREPK